MAVVLSDLRPYDALHLAKPLLSMKDGFGRGPEVEVYQGPSSSSMGCQSRNHTWGLLPLGSYD